MILDRRTFAGGARWAGRAIAVLVLAVSMPLSAAAQEPPVELLPDAVAPPDTVAQPVVAAPPAKPTIVPQTLNLGLSLFEAYDLTTVTEGLPGLAADPRLRQDTSFTGANASLAYAKTGQDRSLSAVAGSDFRYYSFAPTVLPVNYFGGASVSTKFRRRFVFSGSQNVGYSPFYSFGSALTPVNATQIILPQGDENIALLKTYTADSSASLGWTINRRASFSTSYNFDYVYTPESLYRVRNQGASALFQYQTTRYLAMRFGYGYTRSSVGSGDIPSFDAHDINIGVGYRRPLSFSRHTIVAGNVGSTLLTSAGTHAFFVTGDASLTHQVNQTWTAVMSYSHDVGRVGVLAAPFVTDVVSGSLNGLWTRYVGLNATGGYTHGSAALGAQNAYMAANASGRISGRITRFLPVYLEYVYYYYRFDQSIGLAPGFPLLVNRQGLRTGLSYSIPLIGKRALR